MWVGVTLKERGWGGDEVEGPTAFNSTLFLQNEMNIKGKGLFYLTGLSIG